MWQLVLEVLNFFRIVRMGLKISVVKCIELSSSGKNQVLSRGSTLVIWTAFFLYASCKICFPQDNICYSNKVNRMWVNRPESKQKEFGDHPGDGTCASFPWGCWVCTAPWSISQLQIRVCLCWILVIAFSSRNVPALGHSIWVSHKENRAHRERAYAENSSDAIDFIKIRLGFLPHQFLFFFCSVSVSGSNKSQISQTFCASILDSIRWWLKLQFCRNLEKVASIFYKGQYLSIITY